MMNSEISEKKTTMLHHFNGFTNSHSDINRKKFSDIALFVIPTLANFTKKGVSAHLIGTQTEQEKAHTIIKFIAKYDNHNIDANAKNAISDIAEYLIYYGSLNYEILISSNNSVSLHWFTPDNLYYVFGYFFQIIPKQTILENGLSGYWNWFNKLHEKMIWRIKIPNELGGTKKHKKLLRKLSLFSNERIPENILKNSLNPSSNMAGAYMAYNKNIDLYCMQIAKKWGWVENLEHLNMHRTSFFYCYKMLTLRWSEAVLREHIIQEINNLFRRLEIECELKVSGLLTPAEILEIRASVYDGDMSIEEALKQTDIHK